MDNEMNVKKDRLFRFLSISLATLFTMIGVIFVLMLIKFLNSFFGIGYILSFGLSIVLPQLYSLIINTYVLDKFDNKIGVKLLKQEDELDEKLSDNISLGKIEDRFDNLSRENKLKLLNMVKNDLDSMSLVEQVNILNQIAILNMEEEVGTEKIKTDSKKMIRVKDNLNN